MGIFIYCLAKSWKVVGPAQVGVELCFGKPVKVHQSGGVFLLWIPFKFSGLRPWELMRIPKKTYCLVYNGGEDRMAMTRDKQMLKYEVTAYIRFPYADSASMIKVVENGVPLTDKGLKDWAETVILAFVRDVIAEYGYEECLGKDQLEIMNKAVNDKFGKDDKSLFCSTGVCGVNPADSTVGSGEVRIKIEKISPSPELQRKLESVETTKLDAEAAEATAAMNAMQIGGQILGIVAIKHGITVEELKKDLKDNPKKAGLSVAEGGYRESFIYAEDQTKRDRAGGGLQDFRMGSADGTPLPASLTYLSVGGGGGVGVMANGRRGGKQGNRGGKDPSGGDDEDDGKKDRSGFTSKERQDMRKIMEALMQK